MPNPSQPQMPVFLAHPGASGRRPWPVTMLCVGLGVALGWSLWHAADGSPARAFGPGYWAYLAATTGSLASALWGLWRLRRWALWAFPAALLLDTLVVTAMGELHVGVLVLEVLLVAVPLAYHRAFRRHLKLPSQ